MARYSPQEIEQLKTTVDLVALVRSKGIELKPHGSKDLIGLCPFHEDHSPSLVVTPEKNLWHCLGACNSGGSVIDWIMKSEKVSFRHAMELLRRGSASSLVVTDKILRSRATIPRLEAPVRYDPDDQIVLRQVIDYYHERLKQTPAAIQYLDNRGIKSEEALTRFKIGYSDRTLGLRLPGKNRKEGAAIRGRLEKLGLFRESGHEHFNGSVVFPIISEQGEITEIYGRKILDNLRAGTAFHTYLPGPHRGFWNPEALNFSKQIILCEAIIDALSFWVNGYRNVTASYGVSGFTDEMLAAFIDKRVERVHIAYDRDPAGDAAAEKLAKVLNSEGITTLRVKFPHKMDANQYACSVKPADKALLVLLNASVWIGKGERVGARERELDSIDKTLVLENSSPLAASESSSPEAKQPEQPEPPLKEKTPLPSAPAPEPVSSQPPPQPEPTRERINVPYQMKGEDIEITLGDRSYRIRGLQKNLAYDTLKVNIRVLAAEKYYIDTLDVYNARHRAAFLNAAASEIELNPDVLKRDLGRVLLKLEELQEEHINEALKPKAPVHQMSEEDHKAALELLKDPALLSRIRQDVRACGIVGERTNALMAYLAAVTRKLDQPLGVIVQSSSAAGKTSLMDAILAFMPPEDRIKYSAMTGQSLFYMGETDLKHKILAIVEEEGAERASYALKLLQSEGELMIASTGKDPQTGKLITHEYRVEGPVMIFLTTTAVEVDEELQNRCIVLAIDEGRDQTKAIHELQRQQMTLEGLVARENRKNLLNLHRNAQRLLRPLKIVNSYAPRLTFLNDRTRTRRDHLKYLTLINVIALLHQYQRPIRTKGPLQYIEATLEDITVANELAHEVLGRSLDELPPQTRRLLLLLDEFVTTSCGSLQMQRPDFRFSRRDVRAFSNWSNNQVHIHLQRLVDLEYVLLHRGGRGQSFEYELLYDGKGKAGEPFVMRLLDVEQLKKHNYDADRLGQTADLLGSICPQSAPVLGSHESAQLVTA